MRTWIGIFVGTFIGLLLLGGGGIIQASVVGQEDSVKRPNIVLILGDDQAWSDYGFMGNSEVQTPNLDRLAKQSLLFERGYLASPICRPSLASIVTGLVPITHGVTGNDVVGGKNRAAEDKKLRANFYRYPNFVQALTDSGYLALQTGKWWEGSWNDGGFTHGMTHGDPKRGGRHGDAGLSIGRKGLEPISEFMDLAIQEKKPFFVWYAPFLPHTPHNPPQDLLAKYQTEGRPKDLAKYYAMCEWHDQECGALLNLLETKNVADDTVVIFLCDNGWRPVSSGAEDPNQKNWRNYAMKSKGSPYENGIRTPIMISWPGQVEAQRSKGLAHSIDLFPTIAQLANLEAPESLSGVDLLNSSAVEARDVVFGVTHSTHNITMGDSDDTLQYLWCVSGDWKLIVRYQGKDTTRYRNLHVWDTAPVHLYQILKDPAEQRDVAEQYPEVVRELKEKIEAWHKDQLAKIVSDSVPQ